MRGLLVALLLVHGAIHTLGFVQAFGLARTPLTGRTLRPWSVLAQRRLGVGWLAIGIGLFGSGLAAAFDQPWWWIGVLLFVGLSQLWIINAWPEAKAGTIPNLILLMAALAAHGQAHFQGQIEGERAALFTGLPDPGAPITPEMVQALPPPIARWLSRAGVVGRPAPRSVHLEQRGGLRTAPDQAYAEANAEQWFRVDPPGFIWSVQLSMYGLPVLGRDRYQDQRGHMWITVAGLWPLVDATGDKIDEGTAQRFLGELVWFPAAALSERIRWVPIDQDHARAFLRVGDQEVSADFEIDDLGRFERMTAERFLGGGPEARRERWEVPATAWRRFQGIEVPSEGRVTWKLPDGDFEYYRWEITSLSFDEGAKAEGAGPNGDTGRSLFGAAVEH